MTEKISLHQIYFLQNENEKDENEWIIVNNKKKNIQKENEKPVILYNPDLKPQKKIKKNIAYYTKLFIEIKDELVNGISIEAIERVIEKNNLNREGKELVLEIIIRNWLHELLPEFYDKLRETQKLNYWNRKDKICNYSWLNYVTFAYNERKRVCPRTIDDGIKTIDFLMQHNNSIIDVSKYNETPFDGLRVALMKKEYINEIDYQIIYDRFTNLYYQPVLPHEQVDNKNELYFVALKINNCITETKIKLAPIINYIIQHDARALADVFIREMLSYRKIIRDKNIRYPIVKSRIDTILKMIYMNPSKDNNFRRYFQKNPWNPELSKEKFLKSLFERCKILDPLLYQDEKYNFEIIGAIIGTIFIYSDKQSDK